MLIFLVGFMGCGKSYLAKNLAADLNIDLIDMDKHIERATGQSISEIFTSKGEPWFREQEQLFINELFPKKHLIVSTGGGTPCFYNNMDLMNEKGITIYLNRSKEKAFAQLVKGKDKRPLIKDFSDEELSLFYDKKLAERQSFYEKANFWIGDREVDEIILLVKSLLL